MEQEMGMTSGINTSNHITENGPEMEQCVRKQELPSFKAQTELLRIHICSDQDGLFTPNEIQTPQGYSARAANEGMQRSSSQLHKEIILE